MANSPSQHWENGRMVSRGIETNRWRILSDGTKVADAEDVEATTAKPYKAPTPTKGAKAVTSAAAENKSVSRRAAAVK